MSLTASNDFGSNTITKTAYISTSSSLLPDVDFTASEELVCTGTAVAFNDNSTYLPRSWEWSFTPETVTFVEGTDAFSQNPVVVFDAPASYSVSLTATNLNGSASDTKFEMITVGGETLPFEEYFQSISFEEAGWEIWNPDNQISWEITQVGGLNETDKAAVLDFTNYYAIGERDRLITPPLNLSGFDQVNLAFKHAYAKRHDAYADSLIIYVSDDCGNNWTRIFADAENGSGNIATHPQTEGFVPINVWDWCGVDWGADCITLNLNEWAGQSDIRVAFETYSFYGNPLYITAVELGTTVSVANHSADNNSIQILPNPTNGQFRLQLSEGMQAERIEIMDISGRQLFASELAEKDKSYDFSYLPNGVYIIQVKTQGKSLREKLIIE